MAEGFSCARNFLEQKRAQSLPTKCNKEAIEARLIMNNCQADHCEQSPEKPSRCRGFQGQDSP
jgi:hypothetical protein